MEGNGEGASTSSAPTIRIEPPVTALDQPPPSLSPSKTKSASQSRSKTTTSRRGFALKRIKSSTPNCGSDSVNPLDLLSARHTKESRSLSPLPPFDGVSKPTRDSPSESSIKTDMDVWTNRKASSPLTDYDLEELLRSRSLRRVTSRIQDDNKASADVEKIPERFLTDEVCGTIWERSRATVGVIEKLQRHFSVVKEKLYRARCLGMDQGIEAVQKGDSPLLEQHLLRIQMTRQEEMKKAKALQEARKESIEIEYDNAVTALWESMDLQLARRMKLSRHRMVEEMIKNESDLMHNQLRHIFGKLKEEAGGRGVGVATSQMVNGVLIDTSMEVSLDESMADMWKLMKASVKQKYWEQYLSPEAEARLEEEEAEGRRKVIRAMLLQGGQPPKRKKNNHPAEGGKQKRQMTDTPSGAGKEGRSLGGQAKLSSIPEDAREAIAPSVSRLPEGVSEVSGTKPAD